MFSSEASCSDCKIEFIHRRWSKLLLKWINRCVNDKGQKKRERRLSPKCLLDIVTKYKGDVCGDDFDRAMLCTDDIEPFIKYKYPILRLRYLSEEHDAPKKLFIMTSMLLYHCCMNSHSGVVHEDIYSELTKQEQELVLKFCERLSEMETTINNVEVAIQDAFTSILMQNEKPSPGSSFNALEGKKSSDTAAIMSSSSTTKSSVTTLPSDAIIMSESTVKEPPAKFPLKLTSDITVLPSVVTDTSTFSDMLVESDEGVAEQSIYVDSEQFELYAVENFKPKRESKRDLDEYQKDEREKSTALKDYDRKRQNEEHIIVSRQQVYEKKDDTVTQRQLPKENAYDQEKLAVNKENDLTAVDSKNPPCLSDCTCKNCSATSPESGDPGSTMGACACDNGEKKPSQVDSSKLARLRISRKITAFIVAVLSFIILVVALSTVMLLVKGTKKQPKALVRVQRLVEERSYQHDNWKCTNNLCHKVYGETNEEIYYSYSRCSLSCMGPQIWPIPIGHTEYSSNVIALATNKLGYKLKTVSSDSLHRHLAEALKLFIGDLAILEKTGQKFKTNTLDSDVKKMSIQIDVESDPDPRIRLNTEESYQLKVETTGNRVIIMISASSFCGVRHGLETLTQMILLDKSTGYLITVSNAVIKDAPSYKYRGLMIDTGRNYIPVKDLMRTVDAMATVKLNTFHWRISDAASFPLFLPKLPQLFQFGAYHRSMIYTKDDVEAIVKRAGVRGIRVLIEVAAPGPVGRPWSWNSGTSCPLKNNDTCDNILCTILEPQESVLDVLQNLYQEILEMTQVEDIFHLSNGVFSLANCFNLMNNRDGFLDKALDSLKRANKGFLPKLPIIWYTSQLGKDFESKTWERFGVQLNEWKTNPSEQFLAKFKLIHSSKWDLSCEVKKQRCVKYRNWQEMYSWKSWRKVEAFTVEGGEATLWTDMVDSGNLDYHLWPRTAAVAERLWSDLVANASADGSVYVRLNNHRSRMLHVGVKAQAIWPAWCTSNPGQCLEKVR